MVETLSQLIDKQDEAEKTEGLFGEANRYKAFVKEQFEEMKGQGRRFKYWWIRNTLESLEKYPSTNPDTKSRMLFLNYYYGLMRHWDDIADGDKDIPKGFPEGREGRIACIQNALEIVNGKNLRNLDTEAQDLANFCFELGKSFGEDFRPQAKELLEHMLNDTKRLGTNQITQTEEELNKDFEKEISGCAKATRKIYGEKEEADKGIYPLARAVQTYYMLRDFFGDVKKGLINISGEEMQKYNLSLGDLGDSKNSNLKKWFADQAEGALKLMKEYEENIGKYNLQKRTRFTLDYSFKLKAKLLLLRKKYSL